MDIDYLVNDLIEYSKTGFIDDWLNKSGLTIDQQMKVVMAFNKKLKEIKSIGKLDTK